MVFEVIAYAPQLRCGGGRPADTHGSGAQHLFEAGVHLFLFNGLASVGLRDTFTHRGAEPGVFLKQTQGGVLHQVRGVGP